MVHEGLRKPQIWSWFLVCTSVDGALPVVELTQDLFVVGAFIMLPSQRMDPISERLVCLGVGVQAEKQDAERDFLEGLWTCFDDLGDEKLASAVQDSEGVAKLVIL